MEKTNREKALEIINADKGRITKEALYALVGCAIVHSILALADAVEKSSEKWDAILEILASKKAKP